MKTSLKVASASAALFASVAMTGCGSNSSNTDASASASSAASGSVSGKVEVYAAASLRNAGTELKEAFEKENPGVEITYSFEGSSKLVQKIEQGEDADLLITAATALARHRQNGSSGNCGDSRRHLLYRACHELHASPMIQVR